MTRFLPTALLLLGTALAASPDVSSIAKRVDSHYNHLRSMRASFVETYQGAGIARRESGTLLLKQPGRMRWDYSSPQQKIFLSDGKSAYFYVPGDRQARKTSIKNLDDLRSPLRFLLGKTELQKEFRNLQVIDSSNGVLVLEGVPKGMEERVASLKLTIDQGSRIQGIEIKELDGSTTHFEFSQMIENEEISDAQFRFRTPEGVELIESNDLAP
jgi:outer membrane lipoprotein carrier protein